MADIASIYNRHVNQFISTKIAAVRHTELKKFKNNDYFLITPRIPCTSIIYCVFTLNIFLQNMLVLCYINQHKLNRPRPVFNVQGIKRNKKKKVSRHSSIKNWGAIECNIAQDVDEKQYNKHNNNNTKEIVIVKISRFFPLTPVYGISCLCLFPLVFLFFLLFFFFLQSFTCGVPCNMLHIEISTISSSIIMCFVFNDF